MARASGDSRFLAPNARVRAILVDIPAEYQRIREDRVERIIKEHMSKVSPVSRFLFDEAFPGAELVTITDAELHVLRDHRNESGNPLAYGETDIEIIGACKLLGRQDLRLALLMEMKVDAPQTENQGLRYRARANFRKQVGSWDQFICILVAPSRYLESAYPLDDYRDAGWDRLIALEDILKILKKTAVGFADSAVIAQAVRPINAWNRPIPSAAQFWDDLSRFQRTLYPDVPIFINRQRGAGIFVWPSFYENQLANNKNAVRRKRVQIVHSGKTHVALYIKNVKFSDFLPVARPLIGGKIQIGAPGLSWQSVKIEVPFIDPLLSVEVQLDSLAYVFQAARDLYDYFIENEDELLGVPTFK